MCRGHPLFMMLLQPDPPPRSRTVASAGDVEPGRNASHLKGAVMDMLIVSKAVTRPMRRIRLWAMASCLGCSVSAHALQPALAPGTDPGKLPGYYALDLEAPSSATRGKCVAIGITALGKPQQDIRLVARLPNLPAERAPSTRETIKVVPVAALRASRIDVCLDEISALLAMPGAGMPASLEIAIFAAGSRTPAASDSSSADGDGLRLSDWMFLPAPAWRFEAGSAGVR